MDLPTNKSSKLLLIVFGAMFLVALGSSFYVFYWQKDYTFLVEAACSNGENCFVRHCGEEECPPSALEVYRLFAIKAADYSECSDATCFNECASGAIECSEVTCGESPEDICLASFE